MKKNSKHWKVTDESLLNISKTIEYSEANDPLEIVVLRGGKIVTLGRK